MVWLTTEDNSACWQRLYNTEHGAPMPNPEYDAAVEKKTIEKFEK